MKRSRSVALTSLMAGAGLSVSACDQSATHWGGQAQRVDQPAAYRTLQECKASGETPADQCDRAYAQAQADAPKFNDRQTCEQRYGVDQCVPRNQAGGGSVFMPLLAGFMIGRALNGGGGYGGGFGGAPIFRDRNGGYVGGGGYGGGGFGGFGGGRTSIGRSGYDSPSAYAPSRVQSRSSVISRGGFGGGGGRSFGFGG